MNPFGIFDFGFWIRRTGTRKVFCLALSGLLFGLSVPVNAQQQGKIAKIGELYLRPGSTVGTGRELFRRSLRELGYSEGKNVVYESRSAEGNPDRFPELAEELVRLRVDVFLTTSRMKLWQLRTLLIRSRSYFCPKVILLHRDSLTA